MVQAGLSSSSLHLHHIADSGVSCPTVMVCEYGTLIFTLLDSEVCEVWSQKLIWNLTDLCGYQQSGHSELKSGIIHCVCAPDKRHPPNVLFYKIGQSSGNILLDGVPRPAISPLYSLSHFLHQHLALPQF